MEKPNLTYINKISGGDITFETKIISILKAEFPNEKAIYYQKVKQNNFEQIAEIVHKLKHKISILDLQKAYNDAVKYESNLLNQNMKGKTEFESTLETITDYLGTL